MKANFYPQLTLKDERRKIEAAGPLNWNEVPPEIGRLAIVAVVTQDGVRGCGTSREYRREDGEREWWCEVEVESGVAFAPGPAPSAGSLYATRPAGLSPWPWPADPELVET